MGLYRYGIEIDRDFFYRSSLTSFQSLTKGEEKIEPKDISFMIDIVDPTTEKIYARVPRVSLPENKATAKDILAKLTDFQLLFEGYEIELIDNANMSRVASANNLSHYRLCAIDGPRKIKIEIYLPHSGGVSTDCFWLDVRSDKPVSDVVKSLIPASHPWLQNKKFRVLNKENLELLDDRIKVPIRQCRSLIIEVQSSPVFLSYEEGKTIGGFKYGIMFERGNSSAGSQEIIGDFRNPDKPIYYLAFEKKSDSGESFLVAIDRTHLDPKIVSQWDTYWIAQSHYLARWENTTLMLAPTFIDTILKPNLLPKWYIQRRQAVETNPAPPVSKKEALPKSAISKAEIVKFPLNNENKVSLWSKPNDYQWYGITKQT